MTTPIPLLQRLVEAESRMFARDDEARSIEVQMSDPQRQATTTAADYMRWRVGALKAYQRMRADQRRLKQEVHALREEARLRTITKIADEPVTEYTIVGALVAIVRRATADGHTLTDEEQAFVDFARNYLSRGWLLTPPDEEASR